MAETDSWHEVLLKELAEEYLDRLRRGERPPIAEYAQRHPELAERINEIFPTLGLVELFKPDSGEVTGDRLAEPVVTAAGLPRERLGEFRILREVARGGMGVVYEAEQESLGRHVALKVLSGSRLADPKLVARFEREAKAAARLHHTNIVPVFEVGREGNVWFYVMQFIQGQGLDLVINELRRFRDASRPGQGAQDRARPAAGFGISGAPRVPSSQARQVELVARSLVSGRFASENPDSGATDPPSNPSSSPVSAATDVLIESIEADVTNDNGAAGAEPADGIADGSSARSPMLPGGAQLSTVESGYRPYQLSVARIGQQASQALAYAHSRGIIHRDIKPANLLLDTAGVVWLTDFGLVKDHSGGLTEPGAVVGTLRYMAPERFQGQADARADIYALGLTLYELLALQPAFAAHDRLQVIDQIKNQDPKRLRDFDARIPRDLETIVMKAIDKEPARRYQTAAELADDLRRFTDDQPILARKSTTLERIVRWHRRNRMVAALLSTLLVVLSSGLIGMTWLYRRAENERQRAEVNFRDAQTAVDDYLTKVSQKLLDVPGLQPLRKELLETALKYYQNFIVQHAHDPLLRSDLANTYERVGTINDLIGARPDALEAHQRAIDIRAALAREYPKRFRLQQDFSKSYDQIGVLLRVMGRMDEADQAHRRSTAILELLIAAHPDVFSLQQDLARSYNNLGLLQKTIGRTAEAERSYRRAIEIIEPWISRDLPEFADSWQSLAKSYTNLGSLRGMTGNMVEARQWFQKAIPVFESLTQAYPNDTSFRQDLAKTHNNIGVLQSMTGEVKGTERSYRQAIEIQERLVQEHPSVIEFQEDLAKTCTDLGILLAPTDRPEAARWYQHAIDIQEPLVRAHPQVVSFEQDLARSYSVLGMLQTESGLKTVAMASLERAITIQRRLVRDHPKISENAHDLSSSAINMGKLRTALGRPADALRDWQDAARLIESLPDAGPYDLYNLAIAYALSSTVIDWTQAQLKPKRETSSGELLDKAMEALRRSVSAGWSDARQMETDDDLKPLRLRQEFQKLVKTIQKN